jgi:hypothetical protein
VTGRDRESDGTQAGIFREGKVVQTHQLYEVLHDRHGIEVLGPVSSNQSVVQCSFELL